MKTSVTLTDTQAALIKPLVDQYNDSKQNLSKALVLVVGRPFGSYSLTDNVLTFEEHTEIKDDKGLNNI